MPAGLPNTGWDKFFKAALDLDPSLETRIDNQDLKAEFEDHLWRMEESRQ